MHATHHIYHYLHNLLKNKALDEFYVAISFRFFALSLINIFVPIYLLEQGFGITTVMGYLLIFFSAFFVIYYMSGYMTEHISLKNTLIISLIPLVPYFMLLDSAAKMPLQFLLFLPVIYSLGEGIFWRGFQSEFSKLSSGDARGEQVSFIYFLIMLFMTIGPLAGALFIDSFSYTVVFAISVMLLILSAITLFLTKDIRESKKSSKIKFDIIFSKDLFAYIGNGMVDACRTILWPLIIYLSFVNILLVGKAFFIAEVAMAAVILFAGWLSSKINKEKILRIGAVLNSGSWFLRLFSLNTLKVFAYTIFDGISFGLILIPYETIFYDKTRKYDTESILITRQFGLTIGRIAIILVVLITQTISFAFLLAAFGTLLHFFFKDN